MTEFWLKLLGAKADDAMRIAGASLALRGGLSSGWYVFLVLATAAAVYWIYRNSPVTLAPWRRRLLTVLRVGFLALMLALLLRPVLAFTVEGSVRRLLVVLLDASSSMQIRDPRLDAADQKRAALARGFIDATKGLSQNLPASRAKEVEQIARVDVMKAALQNAQLNLLPRLEREFDVSAFSFGQGVAELSAPKSANADSNAPPQKQSASTTSTNWIERFQATAPTTALGDAIREVMNRKRGQPLAGVVMMTDGANNAGSPPRDMAALARQERVPLYVYGVGLTSPRDIIVANLFAPDVTFVQDEVPVTVRVRAQGLAGQSAEVALKLDQVEVARRTIALTEGEQVVALKFTPTTRGEFDLSAEIAPRSDEAVKDNNTRSQRLRVIDAKIKVLQVDQSPRWEFRYLQAMLLRDRRVELKCFLVEGDKAIARGEQSPYLAEFPATKDELFKFDLILFGDVDPRRVTATQLENLSEWVARFGGALVMIAGKRFAPHGYRRTAMERLLPVEFDAPTLESNQDPIADKPIKLELTAAGRASAMLKLSDKDEENAALWKQLPPIFWTARIARPKPAAEVLLVDPDPAKESRFGKMPVVAAQQYGLGQVLFVGTDNTWRWRKNVGDVYYTALWGQIAQRVSIQRLLGVAKRTQLTTDRQNYATGERVAIYARLYSGGYDPVQDPTVKGFHGVKGGAAKSEVMLRPVPEQPGLYRAEFLAGAAGLYEFSVEPDPSTTLEFTVTEPTFELGDTAMNEPLLKDLAATTGGAFFREEDLHRLPDAISAKTERVRSPLEVELWCSPLFFLLLLGVVSAEWVLRKWSHLK